MKNTQENLITLNISLPEKHLKVRVPKSLSLRELQAKITPSIIPDDNYSIEEFDEKSKKQLKPRESFHMLNPFLHRSLTAPSIPTITTSTTTRMTESTLELETKQADEEIETLYMSEFDPGGSLKLEETKNKLKKNEEISNNGVNDPQDVFVYRGQILDYEKRISDYFIADYSTVFYGKPRKVTFKNVAQNKLETFYTTSETLAGELREMIGKMGMLDPQEELMFNQKALSDHDIPELSTSNSSISQDEIHLECKKKFVRVLALDGGGIRGVAMATILEEIEAVTQKRIHELFDVIVGTSTGGLLALMMTVPTKEGNILTAKEAKQVYIDKRYEMFKKNPWFKNSLANPKYTGESFENVVKEIFGDNTIRRAIIPMGVVVTDYDLHKSILVNSMRAQIHEDDYRHNVPVWKAARGTTAAPTFFPPMVLGCNLAGKSRRSVSPTQINDPPEYTRGSIRLEDGGTTTNNPTLLAIKYAQRALKVTGNSMDYDFQVVSVGTGNLLGYESPPPVIDGNGSLLNFVSKFTGDPLFIARNSYNVHNQVLNEYFDGKEGPGSNYFRVQFKINKDQWHHMDNCEMSNIKGLINAARFYMYGDFGYYSHHFQGLLAMISADVPRPNLKIDYTCPNCKVGTRFYMFLSDYFYHQKLSYNFQGPSLLKDTYQVLKEIDKIYIGARSKPKSYKKWLIESLAQRIGAKIADSIISYVHFIADHIIVRLPDRAEKDFAELRRRLINLDYESTLNTLEIKGTLSEVFQTRDKIFRGLAKMIRKAILDSQLYRDICNNAKSIVGDVGTRIRKTYPKPTQYNQVC